MILNYDGLLFQQAHKAFAKTRQLASSAALPGCSMGMSEDYELALDEGATVIRVGRALFQ